MNQKVATEKDMFLQTFQREFATTLNVLKAYPADKSELKPADKCRCARDLAWTFVIEQGVVGAAIDDKIDFSHPMPPAPAGFNDVISAFEKAGAATTAKVSNTSDEALNKTVKWPVGPGKMADLRTLDVLWFTLMDQVHHRGQLSVYLRIAGGKLPSIYGPTADESWA